MPASIETLDHAGLYVSYEQQSDDDVQILTPLPEPINHGRSYAPTLWAALRGAVTMFAFFLIIRIALSQLDKN
jgi:hypothetical protein